ncbi:unnamed protein product [marine sediment metagenome]|uniref:YvrJ family protein n=1 Tax=marine sediment metagenome TaxID=412755 RepID=X1EFH8_9ZZZZ
MNSILEFTLQYGIAGVALYMMYSITYNHLTDIKELLQDIKSILSKG